MPTPQLGLGAAFGQFVDSERQSRDLRDAAHGAAQMFAQIGTPEAKQYADLFVQNPSAAFAMGKQVGGLQNLLALAQAQAARSKLATSRAGLAPGSSEDIRAIGDSAVDAGEYGAYAQIEQLARPEPEKDPITREFKTRDAAGNETLVTRQFDRATRKWHDVATGARFDPNSGNSGWGFSVGADGSVQAGVGLGAAALKEAVAQRSAGNATMSNVKEIFGILDKAPGIAGAFGKLTRPAAGLAGAAARVGILPPGSGQNVAAVIPGATQESLQRYQTLGTQLVATAKTLSADRVGAQTEYDIQRLNEMSAVNDWMTDDVQVRAAMQQLAISTRKNEIVSAATQGITSPYDPTTDAGADRLYNDLKGVGVPEEDIQRVFTEVIDRVEKERSATPLRPIPRPVRRGSRTSVYGLPDELLTQPEE